MGGRETLGHGIGLVTRKSKFRGQNHRTSHALLDGLPTSKNEKYQIWIYLFGFAGLILVPLIAAISLLSWPFSRQSDQRGHEPGSRCW